MACDGKTGVRLLYSSPAEALVAVSLSEYAMLHENVEIVRAAAGRLQPGDFVATVSIMSPDCECDWSRAIGHTADSR